MEAMWVTKMRMLEKLAAEPLRYHVCTISLLQHCVRRSTLARGNIRIRHKEKISHENCSKNVSRVLLELRTRYSNSPVRLRHHGLFVFSIVQTPGHLTPHR